MEPGVMGVDSLVDASRQAPVWAVGLTLLGMAGATYLTRVAGLFLISRIKPTPRVEAFLLNVPASILVAIIVPNLVKGTPAELLAAAVTAVVAALTRNLVAALFIGVAAVVFFRWFWG